MPTVAETKERVQAYLTREFDSVTVDGDGDYSLAAGSTQVFVRVMQHPNDESTIVSVWAPVLAQVEPTAELFEYVATKTDSWFFGHLSVEMDEQGLAFIAMSHRLLGDFLDLDELMFVVVGIGQVADRIDDELQVMFGGMKFREE